MNGDEKPKFKLKAHHVGGIGAILSLYPGFYATKTAMDFFLPRREAYAAIKDLKENAKEMHAEYVENTKILAAWMEKEDNRIMNLQVDMGIVKGQLKAALEMAKKRRLQDEEKELELVERKKLEQKAGG